MDDAVGRNLLLEKMRANIQRRQREELLTRLPPFVSKVLGESPCIYSAEIDPILHRFLPFNRSGVGSEGFVPSQYHYAEVAWEDKMLGLLPRLVVPRLVGKAFLLLKPPSSRFKGPPDIPLFVVDFQWAAPLLKELWPYSTRGMFLVEKDLRAGVLLDNYIGYLADDLNPKEVVYEVALWPTQLEGSEA